MTHTYRPPFFFLSGDVASSRRSCVTWPQTLCSIGSSSGLMALGIWFSLLVDRSCSGPVGGCRPSTEALEAPTTLDRQLKAPPPMRRGMNPLSMSDLFWRQKTEGMIVRLPSLKETFQSTTRTKSQRQRGIITRSYNQTYYVQSTVCNTLMRSSTCHNREKTQIFEECTSLRNEKLIKRYIQLLKFIFLLRSASK